MERLEGRICSQIAALSEHLKALAVERQRALDAALAAADRARESALLSAEKAVLRAQADIEKRFDSVNEFRQTLSDQAATFATRIEVDQRYATIEKDLRIMSSRIDKAEGASTGRGGSWVYLVQVVSLIGALVAIYLSTRG
jgi:hypothetical protein